MFAIATGVEVPCGVPAAVQQTLNGAATWQPLNSAHGVTSYTMTGEGLCSVVDIP